MVYIHFFWYADWVVRKSAEQGRAHPWRKFCLQDRFEAGKHHRMIERQGADSVVAEQIVEPPQTTQSPWNVLGYFFELSVYALPLLTWDIPSPRRHRRLAAFAAPTTFQVLRDVTCGLLLYDLLFFCGHFMMPKIPFINRTIHAPSTTRFLKFALVILCVSPLQKKFY
jgi:hypothetical protein